MYISIWQNRQTGTPSIQVGAINIDLNEETPLQALLFKEVMNHPDAIAAGAIRAPLTQGIIIAFEAVVHEYLRTLLPRMSHVVEVKIE